MRFTRGAEGSKVSTQRHGRSTEWRVRWYDDPRKMRAKIEHELREGSYRDRRIGQTSFGEVAEEWLAPRTDITLSGRRSFRLLLDGTCCRGGRSDAPGPALAPATRTCPIPKPTNAARSASPSS